MSAREERLMPNDIPRYVRCYRMPNGEFIVVFTRMGRSGSNRYSKKGKGYPYLTTVTAYGSITCNQCENERFPLDRDKYSTFNGRSIDFQDLPAIVRQEVRNMYIKLWRI